MGERFAELCVGELTAAGFDALLCDRPRREQLATAGLARAQEFDWERVVSAYEHLYTDAWRAKYISKRPNAPGHSRTAKAQQGR